MDESKALLSAFGLDGRGGGIPLSWEEIQRPEALPARVWIQLNRRHTDAQAWLTERSGLDAILCEALLTEETRPRCESHGEGMLVILRGVNLNPGAEPDDTVSIRAWINPGQVITLQAFRIFAVEDIVQALSEGAGPRDVGDFLVHLSRGLADRMAPTVEALDDRLDVLEEQLLESPGAPLRAELATVRRQAIGLRRHLAPQREALSRLQVEPVKWLRQRDRLHLREVADRVMRYVEELDTVRERASVTHEELASRQSEQMNRTMYVLTLVAAVFLPLGFLTGLLGINVAGIPGAESSGAFWIFCGLLGGIVAAELWLFHRMHWL